MDVNLNMKVLQDIQVEMNSRQLMCWVWSSEQGISGDSSLAVCGQGYGCKKEFPEGSVDVRQYEGLR